MWHTSLMPKRTSNTPDVNEATFQMVQRSTQEKPAEILIVVPKEPSKPSKYDISRVMAAMGSKGGKIGGKRRLETMTEAERKRVATKAAKTRWKNAKRTEG